MTVHADHVDRDGEVHTRRMPGTLAAHCSCPLGAWMRERLELDIQRRIPTLSDVINGRTPYVLERPDFDDEQPLTDEAKAFVRRWKDNFGGRMLHGVPAVPRYRPEDVGRALHERRGRIEAASEEGVVVTGGAA